MHGELIVLRFIHVVGGILWVGSVFFTSFFLMPALRSAGPAAAAPVMGGLQRRFMIWMPIIGLLVILSGLRLMMIVSGGDPHWFAHRQGHALAVAASLAIIAFLVGMTVSRPAMVRAGKLAQSAASDETTRASIQAEIRRLQRRGTIAAQVVTWLLLLSATGMAIARYL